MPGVKRTRDEDDIAMRPVKRPRGRPPSAKPPSAKPPAVKRPRGRPPLKRAAAPAKKPAPRPRGRPPKPRPAAAKPKPAVKPKPAARPAAKPRRLSIKVGAGAASAASKKSQGPGRKTAGRFFTQAILNKSDAIQGRCARFGLTLVCAEDQMKFGGTYASVGARFRGICQGISVPYKQASVTDALKGAKQKDGVFLYRDNEPMGLLVVQRGECALLPDVVSLTLICSARAPGVPLGSVLLATFVHTALVRREAQLALQVAYGRKENMNAACTFEKFGFRTARLKGKGCYEDQDPQGPMLLDMKKVYPELINRILEDTSFDGLWTNQCKLFVEKKRRQHKKAT